MSISKKTLEHPVLTLIVFALLGTIGIFTLKNVAVSLMPDVDPPYINVRTTYTNAGPESVEKTVTKVLEGQLVSLSGLKSLTSTSSKWSNLPLSPKIGQDVVFLIRFLINVHQQDLEFFILHKSIGLLCSHIHGLD